MAFFVTPPNRAYAVLAIPAKLRIETIRRRPLNITCTSKHTHNAGGFVVTNSYITIVHDTTSKEHILQQRLQRAKIQMDTIQRYK